MPRDSEPLARRERERPSRAAIAISLAAIAAIVLLVVLVRPLRDAVGDALSGDTESLREDLTGLGAGGVALVLALAVAHSVIWYPTEILNAAAGYIYGFWWALPLMMFGWVINGIICYFIGMYAARPALLRLVGEERFVRYERVVEDGGVTLLLAMRLIPIVPFSLFSYVAGSAEVPLWRFVWTTAVGYLPISALFVYSARGWRSSRSPTRSSGSAWSLIALLLLSHGCCRVRAVVDPDHGHLHLCHLCKVVGQHRPVCPIKGEPSSGSSNRRA